MFYYSISLLKFLFYSCITFLIFSCFCSLMVHWSSLKWLMIILKLFVRKLITFHFFRIHKSALFCSFGNDMYLRLSVILVVIAVYIWSRQNLPPISQTRDSVWWDRRQACCWSPQTGWPGTWIQRVILELMSSELSLELRSTGAGLAAGPTGEQLLTELWGQP